MTRPGTRTDSVESPGVLVIGGAGGLGASICHMLDSEGWSVSSADISYASDSENEFPIDITNASSISRVVGRLKQEESNLDAIVVASGMFDHFALAESEPDRISEILSVNVIGVIHVVASLLPLLRKGGRIVILSSETALVGLPFQPYGMSKRMLECYIDSLRQECALIGISVVSIRPGAHQTNFLPVSSQRLGAFSQESRFSAYLNTVRDKGQRIIQKGGKDPGDVAKSVLKALTSNRPRRHYDVNSSLQFRVMRRLPVWLRERLVTSFLK